MIDTGLIADELRARGHKVEQAIPVPGNAGDWEFVVDGTLLSLEETRALIALDQKTA